MKRWSVFLPLALALCINYGTPDGADVRPLVTLLGFTSGLLIVRERCR